MLTPILNGVKNNTGTPKNMNIQETLLNDIKAVTLSNGFRIVMAPNNVHPIVSLQMFVRMGSCWENEQEAGFSHFLEHLVFKSTQKYPDNRLTAKAMFLGSNINAYTEFDSTCYYLTLSSQFMKEGLEILAELCRFSNFSDKDFSYEKKVVLEELAYYQNDPEDYFIEQIPKLYFIESPYKKPIVGTKESLQKASAKALRSFYHKYYTPGNSFLVVSGDFQTAELTDYAEQFFGDWQEGTKLDRKQLETIYPQAPVIDTVTKNISKPILTFAIPETASSGRESHILDIIAHIFANDKKSRLYRRLFIKEKLVESIKIESFSGINDGLSLIIINPRNHKDLDAIYRIFLEEFTAIKYIQAKEIEETKAELIHSYRYSLEYAKSIGFSLGLEELYDNYKNFPNYPDIITNISEQEIQDTIDKFYKFDKLGIFTLTSENQGDILSTFIQDSMNSLTQESRIGQEEINISQGNKHLKPASGTRTDDFHSTALDSGVKLILKKVTGKPTVGITAAFRTSQLNEAKELRGVNYLTSVLLLYGNDKRSYDQLLNFCSQLGIQVSISASDEVTLLKLKCFTESLNISLEILQEIITTPLFPQEHLLNIQKTIISNLSRMKDYPSQYSTYLWKKQVFGKDSVLLEREGTKGTLRTLTRKKIVNWFHNNYGLPGMALTIVGDFSFSEIISYCNRLFPESKSDITVQPAELFPHYPDTTNIVKFKKHILPENNGATVHVGGFCCSAKDSEKNTAFHLLGQIMGGDINSRLYDELREKRGLAYNVGFGVNTLQDIGYFVAYAIVDKKAASEAISIIIDSFQKVIDGGVTEEELVIAKNSIRGQRLRSEESVSAQATTIATLDRLGYDYDYYLKREERMQKVTTADIKNVAKLYLQRQDLFINMLV